MTDRDPDLVARGSFNKHDTGRRLPIVSVQLTRAMLGQIRESAQLNGFSVSEQIRQLLKMGIGRK